MESGLSLRIFALHASSTNFFTRTTLIEPHTFEQFGLDDRLLKGVKAMGYERPTPIQFQAIPLAMQDRDVMGAAQTGTGKTAAFGLPILHKLLHEPAHGKHVRALVLAPTRELCAQIEEAVRTFSKFTKLRTLAVYGGVSYGPQIDGLKRGVDFLAATPGRLLDHIEKGNIRLDHVEVFVMDEADRMLDMGFLPDIRKVMNLLPKKKQTMLFSATFPQEILKLSKDLLNNPEHVQVGDKSSTATGITHTIYPVPAHLKPALLESLLLSIQDDSPILVFTRTKHRADKLQRILSRAGLKIVALHSDRTQKQRQAALDGFRKGRHQILVATDIAARGIDIVGISHVINYDVPATPEDYVHRTGRTARAQREGDAFTLMAPDEELLMIQIEKHMKQTLPREALRDFNYGVPAPEKRSSLEKTSGQVGPTRKSFSSGRRRIPRKV